MCKVNSPLFSGQNTPTVSRVQRAGDTHWVPNTDVYVTDNHLVIKVELAGMRREDLELTVQGQRLMISGQRPDGGRGSKCNFLVMEINYGPFECVLEMPPGYDLGKAHAAYQNGFLRVEVPKGARTVSKMVLAASTQSKA
jgi:HSP20 family protein